MLEWQLRDEDRGSGMQPGLASGGSSSTTRLHSEIGESSLLSSHHLALGMWMVFAGMALKPCQIEGTGYSPFPEGA